MDPCRCLHRQTGIDSTHCPIHGPSARIVAPHVVGGEPADSVPTPADDRHAFASGAKSSGKLPRYDLVPWDIFAPRLAARYQLGSEKYGDDNWMKGIAAMDRDFVLDRANHMLEHAMRAVANLRYQLDHAPGAGRIDDDDFAAVIWGAICCMAAQKMLWARFDAK
jgi:hypothetical protein